MGKIMELIIHTNNFPILTNGEMLIKLFPNIQIRETDNNEYISYTLDGLIGNAVTKEWWNASYKEPTYTIPIRATNDINYPVD